MNFNFGEVLTRAWQIIWKHKVLWIFGILASCGRSSGNFNSSSRGGSGGNGSGANLPPQVLQWFQTIQEHATAFIAITIAVLCLIWIVVVFLSAIGKIGLIRGTAQADGGTENLIFGQLFSESTPYFWRIFGLSLILGLPVLVLIIVLAGALIVGIGASAGNNTPAMGLLATVPLLIGCVCLLIPVMFVLGMVFSQAQRAIVLEELGIMPALSRGWDVFRNNLGPIILMAIILAVIGFVAGLAIAIPILIIVVPAAFAFAIGNAQNSTPLILAGVCFCLYLPVLLLANGILTAYTESAWTLAYIRLTNKPEGGDQAAPRIEDPVKPEDNDKTILANPNA